MSTLHLSAEMTYLKRSVMRDLLSLATAPDILSLAGGLPGSEYLPLEQYRRCLSLVLKRDGCRALQYHVPVIEDDPYSALRFAGQPRPPITSFDPAGVIFYVGSFSKMLAPSVRLGWIVAPLDLIPKITVIRESIDLESSILTQIAVHEFLASGGLSEHLATFNAANHERRDTLLDALDEYLDGIATWTQPEGGLFVWVTLPETIDATAMFAQAAAHKVIYAPGAAFAANGGFDNAMRLNFSNASPEKLREAVRRLAQVIESELKVKAGS